jgi:hypothetical protein
MRDTHLNVKLSLDERREIDAKAAKLGLSLVDLVVTSVRAYDPGRAAAFEELERRVAVLENVARVMQGGVPR